MSPWEGAPRPPRAWQREALPVAVDALRSGERCIVQAVMGSGKTVLTAELCRVALPGLRPATRAVVSVPTIALVVQTQAVLAERLGSAAVGAYYTSSKDTAQPVLVVCNDSISALAAAFASSGLRAAFLLCDEVHRSEAASVREAFALLRPACALGLTATPFRSDEAERLSLWSRVVYRYSMADALRDGVLVPWRVVNWNGEGDKHDVDGICLRALRQLEGPTVASAVSIADAIGFAEYLQAAGVEAEAIHSGLPDARRRELIGALRIGDLRVLVHVSLLAEGVDLPWLRNLVLRRRVGARTRFVQEFGRVLRAPQGECAWGLPRKTYAIVVDPYDLLGRHGINHPEALGEAPPPEPEVLFEEDFPLLELPPPNVPLPPAVAVSAAGAWVLSILLQLQAAGVVEAGEYDTPEARSALARQGRPSEKQLVLLQRLRRPTRWVPEPHRTAVKTLQDLAPSLRAGVVSDLLSVLLGLTKAAPRGRAGLFWKPKVKWGPVPVLPERVLVGLGKEPRKQRRGAA